MAEKSNVCAVSYGTEWIWFKLLTQTVGSRLFQEYFKLTHKKNRFKRVIWWRIGHHGCLMLFYWHYCLLTNIKGMFCNAYYIFFLMNVLMYRLFSSQTIVLNDLDILVPSARQCFQLLNHTQGWKLSLLWKITCICISLPIPSITENKHAG